MSVFRHSRAENCGQIKMLEKQPIDEETKNVHQNVGDIRGIHLPISRNPEKNMPKLLMLLTVSVWHWSTC